MQAQCPPGSGTSGTLESAAQGLSPARGRLDATDRLLVHAAPPLLRVEGREDAGKLLAFGDQLKRTEESPMTLLERLATASARRDLWPDGSHVGLPVLLGGGEVGILLPWWNSAARDEWRWRIELYNHKQSHPERARDRGTAGRSAKDLAVLLWLGPP